MGKKDAISKFSNSLMEFLLNSLADKHGNTRALAQRYNNLKVYIDPSSVSQPHFFVAVGISEACFSIDDGKKIEGSLGYEDNYVARWAGRSNIKSELEAYWKALKDAISAMDKEDNDGPQSAEAMMQSKLAEINDSMKVDMTGTGLDRSKKQEADKKREMYFKRLKLIHKDLSDEELEDGFNGDN